MDNKVTRAIYNASPSFVRNLAASIYGWFKNRRRRSGEYNRWLRFFEDSKDWSEKKLSVYQDRMLCIQVEEALLNVPYYQKLFADLNLGLADIQAVVDLEKLPILEKSDIVSEGNNLISQEWSLRKINWYPTSGSTGTPLAVPRPKYIDQMESAFLDAQYFGRDLMGQPYSTFTGLELIPAARKKPPFWVDNWSNRQRMYSIFHLNEKNYPEYIKSLNSRYSYYYLGYPSAVYSIAKYMLENSISLDRPPKYFFSGSEELQPHYEEVIREAFGCVVRNHYGQNEFVASITMRDCGHLHADMNYSILEFLPISEEEGEIVAEIIATNMHDSVWPLLRYRTGDLVVYHEDDSCDKGYPGLIIRRIHGRTGHYFTLPDGTRITNISVIAKKCKNVKLMQVRQRKLGSIEVAVVKGDRYTIEDGKNIVSQFRKKIGCDILIDIQYVPDIERASSGKYISIVNEVVGESHAPMLD